MLIWIGGIIGVLITGLVSYLLAVRKMSGKIGTSDADKLWNEATAMRKEYRDQAHDSGKRSTRLEERVAELERNNNTLAREKFELEEEVRKCKADGVDMRATINRLVAALADMEKEKGVNG